MCLYDVQKSQVIILLQEGNGWKNSCALNLIWLDHLLNFIMFEVGIECKCCQEMNADHCLSLFVQIWQIPEEQHEIDHKMDHKHNYLLFMKL